MLMTSCACVWQVHMHCRNMMVSDAKQSEYESTGRTAPPHSIGQNMQPTWIDLMMWSVIIGNEGEPLTHSHLLRSRTCL